MKKFDCHVHLVGNLCGIGSEGELRSLGKGMVQYATGRTFKLWPTEYGDKTVEPETLIKVMKENEVEYAVCLQGNYGGFQNLYTYEASLKYKSLIPAGTYDPFFRKKDLIINHLFDELKLPVIKMEVSNGSGLMANHDTVLLNGDIMNEVYEMANNHHLIFFIDIGRPSNNCYQIDNLVESIKKYPNMKFVVCHLTAPQKDQMDLLKENMNKLKLDNVYFDIASLPNNTKEEYPFPLAQEYIKEAINIVGSDKILWGTDFPYAMMNYSYLESYKYIEDSNLFTQEEKENIFYNNAKKLFKELI